MTYRDDNDALRARVQSLERELADARSELGPEGGTGPDRRAKANSLLGGPTRLGFECVVPGEIDDDGIGELVRIVRNKLAQVGRLDRVKGSTAWSSSVGSNGNTLVEVLIETHRGQTHIKVREGLGNLAGSLFGGVVGGAGGGGLGLIVPLAILIGTPAAVPLLAVGWIATVYAAVRVGYGRVARRREDKLRELIDELEAAASEALGEQEPLAARVRVEDDSALEEAVVAEQEHQRRSR